MDSAPSILGISEIVISVANLPVMREFYSNVLGFPLHSQATHEHPPGQSKSETGEPTICFLKMADIDTPLGRNKHPQFLVLIDYQRHYFARQRLVGHDVSRSTLNHLAFEIPPGSYEAHKSRLEKLNLAPVESSFPNLEAQALFIKDPEGNVLELICNHPSPDS